MSNKGHSPIPWQLGGYENSSIYTTDSHTWLVASCYNTPLPIEIERANAEFIVTACNNHESLLAACHKALEMRAMLAIASNRLESTKNRILAMNKAQVLSDEIRAAIAKAESGELVGRTPNEKDDAPSMEGKEDDNDEPLQSVEFLK